MAKVVNISKDEGSLADQAYARIKKRIFDFDLMPGDRLSESELAQQIKVSRTPLRQALQRLQHEGFVEAIPKVGWLVFLVTVLWAGIYDTLYAMVDRDDDLLIGIRSTAILFGDMDRVAIGIMQLVMVWGLVLVGQNLDFSLTYYAGVVAAALLFGWQQWLARDRSRDQCFRAFLNNNYVGLALFLGIAGEYALA